MHLKPAAGTYRTRRITENADRPCIANEHCNGEPLPGAPVRLCGKHAREMYEYCSDMVTSNWDGAIREYVSDLHDTFKPPKALKQPAAGWLYFIRFGDRVKVGYSTKPAHRLAALPHEQVIGVIPGTRSDEAAWHKLLADFHVTGEWFRADPELLATLDRVVSRTA